MKRYISNYTILPSGEEFVNHITTLSNDDMLISISPFDRELGNTHYAPLPLVIVPSTLYNKVKEIFLAASSREHFKLQLAMAGFNTSATGLAQVVVASLDFVNKSITQL